MCKNRRRKNSLSKPIITVRGWLTSSTVQSSLLNREKNHTQRDFYENVFSKIARYFFIKPSYGELPPADRRSRSHDLVITTHGTRNYRQGVFHIPESIYILLLSNFMSAILLSNLIVQTVGLDELSNLKASGSHFFS